MRCPECNKFKRQDASSDPELDLSIDDDGMLTGTVRLVNVCEDCSTEMTAADLDVEIDFSEEVDAHVEACHEDDEDYTLTIEDETATRSEYTEKRQVFHQVFLTVKVRCSCEKSLNNDGAVVPGFTEFNGEETVSVAARDMEEV